MGLDFERECGLVAFAYRRFGFLKFFCEGLSQGGRINRFATHAAVFQIERDNLVPTVLEHVLKFDGILRAHAPAIPAAGTSCHVVSQMSLLTVILNIDGIGGTIV
jgi:hypothetical protein